MPSGGITLIVGNSGEVRQGFSVTATAPFDPVSLTFQVMRDWVDFRVGTTDGGEEIVTKRRLYEGDHLMTFTPTATCYVVFSADEEGTRYISEPEIASDPNMQLPMPYTNLAANTVKLLQVQNAMFMFHRDYVTRVLERWDNSSWSLRKLLPKTGPFGPINASNVVLAPNVKRGAGQLVAYLSTGSDASFFRETDVDRLFKVTHKGQNLLFTGAAADSYSGSVRVFGIGEERRIYYDVAGTFVGTWVVQRSIGNDGDWRDVATHTGTGAGSNSILDGLDNQIVYYRIGFSAWTSGSADMAMSYNSGSTTGICRVTSYVDVNVVNMQVLSQFGNTSATRDWYAGQWNSADGWPETGAFQDDRFFLGRDNLRWGSQPDDLENFTLEDTDAGAINRRSTIGKSSRAVWMKSAGPLVIGSEDNETILSTGSLDEAITPTTVRARLISDRGSNGVDAVTADTRVVWPNSSGTRLYEMDFTENAPPRDLTRLHEEIAGGGFTDIAMQYEPEPRIWLPRADGQMAVLLYDKPEGVEGWQRYRRGDDIFHSVSVHPLPTEDRIMFIVDREIDGVMMRCLEVTEKERWTDFKEAHRLHCVTTYRGEPTDTLHDLDFYNGQAVIAYADGQIVEGTVEDGDLPLGFEASVVHVGLEAEATYVPGILAYAAYGGTALTQMRKVQQLGIGMLNTPPGIVYLGDVLDVPATEDTDFVQNMHPLADRLNETGQLTFDAQQQTFTGIVVEPINANYGMDARFAIQARKAGPATVLYMVPHMEGSGR